MSKERIEYVDQLKGLAILFVVIGHVYNFRTVDPQTNWVFKLIYSFHLPLFFILSGYVGKITPPRLSENATFFNVSQRIEPLSRPNLSPSEGILFFIIIFD